MTRALVPWIPRLEPPSAVFLRSGGLVGSAFKEYFTDPELAEDGIRRVLAEDRVTDYELTIRSKDGPKSLVSYSATTFKGAEGKLRGVFAAARDITAQKRLSGIRPEMKVLCMSGYTDDSIARHGVLDAEIAYLQKPITPQMLTKRVREVRGAPARVPSAAAGKHAPDPGHEARTPRG